MGCVDPDQRHDDYLSEIVCDFDRTRGMIHTTEPELVLDRFYARLKLDELTSRLRYNIAWYENRGLISDAYKEAKKRVESFNAIN